MPAQLVHLVEYRNRYCQPVRELVVMIVEANRKRYADLGLVEARKGVQVRVRVRVCETGTVAVADGRKALENAAVMLGWRRHTTKGRQDLRSERASLVDRVAVLDDDRFADACRRVGRSRHVHDFRSIGHALHGRRRDR